MTRRYIAKTSAKFGWRCRLGSKKLRGEFPRLTWREIFRVVAPKRFRPTARLAVRPTEFHRDSGRILWETPIGRFWGAANDDEGLDQAIVEELCGQYEWGPVRVRPGDVVLDVGAHLGTFTRIALSSGANLVIALEPERNNAECFEMTFRQEIRHGRVVFVRAAAWRASESLAFTGRGGTGRVSGTAGMDCYVEGAKIDDIVASLRLQRLDFIKMDIEGAERHAICGARRTLLQFSPRMALCIYHYPDDPVVIPAAVSEIRPAYRYRANDTQAYFY